MTNRRIIFVSLERWDYVWRRNQFICAELANRGWEILFVEPARDITYAIRSGTWSELRPVRVDTTVPGGVTRVRPTKIMPNSIAAGRAANRCLWLLAVRQALRKLGWSGREVWWVNDHSTAQAVLSQTRAALVYDVTDDWTAFEESPELLARTRTDDARLCESADAVIVCSRRLHDLKLDLAQPGRLYLVPNGVNVNHYAPARDPWTKAPADTRHWSKPIFLYTGTVHAQRIDVDLVEQVARRIASGSLVFLGPNYLDESDRIRLLATGRVVFHEAVPYAEIPAWMSVATTLIVPHRTTEFVESLNPIKLWEYLASGKPIVSTRVPGFRDFAGLVDIADNGLQFTQALLRSQSEPGISRRQVEVAVANSWISRVDHIETIILQSTKAIQEAFENELAHA